VKTPVLIQKRIDIMSFDSKLASDVVGLKSSFEVLIIEIDFEREEGF